MGKKKQGQEEDQQQTDSNTEGETQDPAAAEVTTDAAPPEVEVKEEVKSSIDLSQKPFLDFVAKMESKDPSLVEKIIVTVPKTYKLNFENGSTLNIPAGVHKLHRFVVDHWYSKANGVKEFKE